MPELAILIPTRGRPGNVNRVIGAWDFTNAWDHADMILVADQDDPEIGGYRELVEMTRHPDTGQPLVRLIEMPEWHPMVHKLNVAARALAEDGDYFALGFAGDDHLPQTLGWAATYLTELHKLGTGMVYGDDGYQGKKLSTEWAVTADAVRALGRMVPAPVEHMYCDNAIMELFGAAGLLTHLPQVRIEHMHPIAGKAENDEQYRRVNSRDQFKKDRDAYESWKNGRMSSDLATLRALRPGVRPGARPLRKESRVGNRSPFPHHFKQVIGATPQDIEVTLADLAIRVPVDQEIVELGVYRGRTALIMAWGAQQGQGAHVTAIDAWDLPGNTYDPPFTDSGTKAWARYWLHSLGYSNRIQLVQAFSHEVGATWTGKPVGLLFVDADHSYEGARRDIETWAPHLAPGAIIAVDDYNHPDWPGVARAVDALVAEGFLAPIDLYHERLAVTRLAEGDGRVTAVTGEGVTPSPKITAPVVEDYHPYPAAEGQVAVPATPEPAVAPVPDTEVSTLEDEWRRVDPEGVAALEESARRIVGTGELEGVAAGTPITGLTHAQAKTLAKIRGITLGTRKDKKAETLQALEEGR